MGEWNRCAEGFAGVKKFNRIFNKTKQNKKLSKGDMNISRNEKGEAPDLDLIICKDSPSGRKRKVLHRSTVQRQSIVNNGITHGTVSASTQHAWKSEQFFEDLNITTKEDSPQHSHEIECALSSSSGNNSASEENQARKPRNVSSNTIVRKIKRRRKRSSDSSLIRSVTDANPKSKANPSQSHSYPKNQDKDYDNILTTYEKDAPDKLACGKKNIKVNRGWTVPSFDQLNPALSAQCTMQHDTKKAKCRVKWGSHSAKPKVVRRLQTELNQDSQGFISDVESDSDGQENYETPQNLHEDQPSASVAVEVMGVINLPDHQAQSTHLGSHDKISPASSPAVDADEEDNSSQRYKDSQISISSENSSLMSLSQTKDKIRASDWVSVLQKQRTPVKNKGSQSMNLEDSGKKKKKFVSGSLADRLFRIQRRLKSSVRMWHHSTKTGELSDKETKTVTVKVMKIDKQMSLYLCQCLIVNKSEKGKVCKVFFSMERADFLSLTVGVTVKIYPPWQQLETSAGERTYLCTDFACMVPTQEINTQTADVHETNTLVQQIHMRAVWDCPCARDPKLTSSSCPAVKRPSTVYTYCQLVHQNSLDSSAQKKTTKGLARLHSVHSSSPCWSQGPLAGSLSVGANRSGPVGRTLQDSKELLKSTGGRLPAFSAMVLRVFVQRYGDKGTMTRYKFLIVDAAGNVAIATLSPRQPGCKDPVKDISGDAQIKKDGHETYRLGQLEGQTCTCHGFMVSSRITSNQDTGLFCILEDAWSYNELCVGQSGVQSQSEPDSISSWQDKERDTSQTAQSRMQVAPNFAYVLQPYQGFGSSYFEPEPSNNIQISGQEFLTHQSTDLTESETSSKQRMFGWRSLSDALKQDQSGDRLTFIAQMTFCYTDENSESNLNSVTSMMVYDQEIDDKGHTLLHTVHLSDQSFLGRLKPSVCLFRDVYLKQGKLQCDQYSLVLPQTQWSAWGVDSLLDPTQLSLVTDLLASLLCVQQLTKTAAEGTVVKFEGCVSAVDEDSACVVEECCTCGSDLIVPDTGPMHCTVCDEDVEQSVSVLRMAGFLVCSWPLLDSTVVKVQFAQKTIEKILPSEADEDGYDVEQVIGKCVSCKACLVESNTVSAEDSSQNRIFLRELEYM